MELGTAQSQLVLNCAKLDKLGGKLVSKSVFEYEIALRIGFYPDEAGYPFPKWLGPLFTPS